jgi:hypothetical protein
VIHDYLNEGLMVNQQDASDNELYKLDKELVFETTRRTLSQLFCQNMWVFQESPKQRYA